MAAIEPGKIRNVAVVGHRGTGKTSLVEALLYQTGEVNRLGSIEAGTTVSDSEEGERAHGRSHALAVVPLVHAGTKINVVDTPGYADYIGELRAGLRASDCALFVVAANEGIDRVTAQLWRECAEVGMPRAVVITKLDHSRADYAGVLAAAQAEFGAGGDKVLPLDDPVMSGSEVTGLVGLLGATDEEYADERGALIEGIIEESEDEGLMERYLGGEPVTEEALLADLHRAMARGTFFPVVPACSGSGVGCAELLDLVVRGFPAPSEHRPVDTFSPAGADLGPLPCDPDGPLVAEVVRTTSDPYVGRVSLVRVFSGTLEPDTPVHVSGHFTSFFGGGSGSLTRADHDDDERIGTLAHPFGAALQPAKRIVAGDIGTVSRLTRAETGDTLSAPEDPRVLRPWSLPVPQLPVAIEAETKSDEDKLSTALARLAAEDPSLRVDIGASQVVLWTMGEAHTETALERLRERFGVGVRTVELVVALRQTFARSATGVGRHVKQSGGHGQYAICEIEVEPLPRGAGFEFAERVVGGVVPKQFIPSVEKGVRAQMDRGVTGGQPLVDVRVTLTGGKAHSVDSSDMAFQSAGALALREAAEAAGLVTLEPYDEVHVRVPEDLVGPVLSDLSSRHGRVLGQDSDDGYAVLRALVPARELVRYPIDLRSATHGTGSFTRAFATYEPADH